MTEEEAKIADSFGIDLDISLLARLGTQQTVLSCFPSPNVSVPPSGVIGRDVLSADHQRGTVITHSTVRS